MHGTTIDALADAPAIIVQGERALLNIGFVRAGFPRLLRDAGVDHEGLAKKLDLLARAAATAEAPDTTDEGRWPDNRAQAIANILARFYLGATGLTPTIATFVGGANEGEHSGPFLDLVILIFAALNIERKAFSYARRAADRLREQLREQAQKSAP